MKHIQTFESFLNESDWKLGSHYRPRTAEENRKLSKNVQNFSMPIPDWQYFSVADSHPEYGPLSKDWHDALKELRVKPEEAGVVFSSILPAHTNNFNPDDDYIVGQARKYRLDFVFVEDTAPHGENGIVFSIK
ncbi:hypothetical protein EBU94_01855 [bacterium]|nr:hypothetical protein [bacterium]